MASCYSPSTTSSSTSTSSSFSSPKIHFFIINTKKKRPSSTCYSTSRRSFRKLDISSSVTDTRSSSYNPLVFQAVRLLGPPARFEASKLKVVFMGEEMDNQTTTRSTGFIMPRTYILSHCDFTANLTLAISNVINLDQLKGWFNKDDVVAEWKKLKDEMRLNVHCHVSGPNVLLDLAAEFRYHIFTKELPLVLKAVLHGDTIFFKEHPELMDAKVYVYFHSSSKKYNRLECWGALRNAAQGRQEDQVHSFVGSGEESCHRASEKWASPKSIVQALVTFLL